MACTYMLQCSDDSLYTGYTTDLQHRVMVHSQGKASKCTMMPDVNIFLSILLIGSITFLFALAGVKIGNLFDDRFEKQAGILGGCILLAIGVKILLEGLGIIG